MITNEEKLSIVTSRLGNLESMINSFIAHAEEFNGKYSLEEELANCNIKKMALLEERQALTNQG
jgi:hypothetical protein